ncbi:tape measure protein [Cupriavidus basilensis]|uniref:tape measure protein n=1 Tax=Cupriavidus basilensis TaxID=68895 RepID=UPI0028507B2F|nr:tape measure protein [Cupriavidus basilensis]MDR3382314.1 tape measure protein [Cupriavidus basilensis]
MSELGNMVVRYRADLADYNQGMAAGASTAKRFGRDVEQSLQGSATRAEQSAAVVARSSAQMSGSISRVVESTGALNRQFDGLMRTIGGIGLGLTITEMVSMSDASTNLAARIGLVSSSAQAATQTQAALYDVAQRTRQQWAGVAQTYSYLAKAGQELGVSQDKILRVTENVSKAIALSGSSAESTQAALVQFSQGLASGTLRGEELNSVLEQAPRLAQALADGLGVSIGELRKLGEEGKLVPAQLLDALDKAGKQLSAEFASMPLTVEQSFTQLQNALMKRISDMNEASGVFRKLADGVSFLAMNLDYVTAALTGLVAAKSADWALNAASSFARKADATFLLTQATRQQTTATLLAMETEVADTAAKAANAAATSAAIGVARAELLAKQASANAALQSAEATIAAATATGALSGSLRLVREAELQATAATVARSAAMAELAVLGQQQARVNLEIATATAANTAAQRALATAQTAASAGAGIATRALGVLGGPLGAVVTVLGLGVTAWEMYSARQRESAREAVDSSGKQVAVSGQTTQQIVDDLNKQIAKYKERNEVRDGAQSGDTIRLADQKEHLANLKKKNAALTPEQRAANPYAKDLLDEAREENTIMAAEAAMKAKRVRELEAENEKFDRQLKGVNENYEKYITTQKALLAEGAITLTTYTSRVKTAYDKWAGGAKDAEEANKAFQNMLGGEMAAIEQQSKLREDTLKRELANVDRLRRNGQITESEALARSYDARETALQGELAQAKQLEELAAGKKEMAARQKYRGERVRIEAELKAIGQERVNALQDQNDQLYRQQTELDQKTLLGIEQRIVAVRQETDLYGKLPSTIESVTVARMRERREAIAMLDPMSEQLKAIDAEIEARERLRDALYTKEATEAHHDQVKKTEEEWKRLSNELGQGLTDSFFRAFESGKDFGRTFFDGLKNMAKTTLLRIPIQYVQNGILSAFGMGGTSGTGGDAISGISNLYGAYDKLKTGYGLVSGWLGGGSGAAATGSMFGGAGFLSGGTFGGTYGAGGAAYAANAGLTVSGTVPSMTLGGSTAGLGALNASAATGGAGAASGFSGAIASVPIAGWVAAGMAAADSLFSKGWDYQKVDVNTLGKIYGSATFGADRLLRGIGLSDRVANLLSGASTITALFGRKKPEVQASGIEGTFTADGFAGQGFTDWKAKGGWFRSDKKWTDYSALDDQQSAMLGGAVKGSLGFYRNLDKLAGGAGLSDRLGSFSYSVRTDLREQSAVDQMLKDMANSMGQQLLPELERFQKQGESISDTAQRLTDVFSATNIAASVLGKTTERAFGGLGLSTAQVRQSLVDLAGGLEAFNSKVADYYAGYFSEEEKIGRLREQLNGSFRELGFVMPSTRRGFRDLVESMDLSTEEGQTLFDALMNLAPSFGQVADAAAAAMEATKAFSDQVKAFQDGLKLGNLSTLTPEQQYAEAKRRYEETSSKALGGDADARSQWTQIAQAFLEASRAYYASGGKYAADFDLVNAFRPDGSHANGLAYVPFDGYRAELHEGERVLTRAENVRLNQAPNWSEYGRGGNAALVEEVKALRAELQALRDDGRRGTVAHMELVQGNHKQVMETAGQQRLLLDDIANNIK